MTKKNLEKHKPTVEDWAKIRVLFLKGMPLDDILKELPDVVITKKSISEKMCREEEKIAANEKHIELFNESLDLIQTLLEQYKDELSQGKSKPRASAYNMDLIMSAISKAQKGIRVALGMDEEGNLESNQPDVLVIEGFNEKEI